MMTVRKSCVPNAVLIAPALVALILACSQPAPVASDDISHLQLYSNSFEFSSDTTGWSGYGLLDLTNEPAPGNGRHSARISGGCVIPHAAITLLGPAQAGYVSFKCWAKDLAIGGSVELSRVGDPATRIVVNVTDTTWTHYAASDSLFCPADDSLRLELISGGYNVSAMLVDGIEVAVQ